MLTSTLLGDVQYHDITCRQRFVNFSEINIGLSSVSYERLFVFVLISNTQKKADYSSRAVSFISYYESYGFLVI